MYTISFGKQVEFIDWNFPDWLKLKLFIRKVNSTEQNGQLQKRSLKHKNGEKNFIDILQS